MERSERTFDWRLRTMNIIVVAPHPGRDVLQPHLDKLLPALLRHEHTVEFLGWDRTSRWPQRSHDDGIDYTMILRGGGFSSRRLLLWMPAWYLVATLTLIRRKPKSDEVVMAMDFEAAFPAAIARRIRGHRFIYNCRDNVSMRYHLPATAKSALDWLDGWTMDQAEAVIFPDESRIPEDAPTQSVVIGNCAPEVEIADRPDLSMFTVYATGNLRDDRGIGLLLDAAAEIEGCRVLAAGKCRDQHLAARLSESPNVDYRGVLSPTEALELCGAADVVFTFYAPGLEINRKAVSNKWSDAMMASRPILINSEVEKSAWVLEQGIGYACAYDKEDLVQTLRYILSNRSEAASRGARGRELWESGYRWDAMEKRLMELIEGASSAVRADTQRASSSHASTK